MSLSLYPTNSVAASSSKASRLLASLRERGINVPNLGAVKTKELRSGHRLAVRGLGWSIDGRKLATCGADRTIRIWVPERSVDHRASTELRGHTESVDQLVWHPNDAEVLATASADKTVRIWDSRTKTQVGKVQTPGSNINVAYHPSGTWIAVGDKQDTVSIIDTRQQQIVHTVCTRKPATWPTDESSFTDTTIQSSHDEINELTYSPDGSLLLLSSGCGSVHLHSTMHSYRRVHSHRTHLANVFCLQWDPLSRFVATASSDAMIALWDPREWYATKMITNLSFPARSIGFSFDGELLASAGEDAFISINSTGPTTDLHHQDQIHQIPLAPNTIINTLAWHPSRYVLAYAGDDPQKDIGTVRVFNL